MAEKDQRSYAQRLWDAGSSAVSTTASGVSYVADQVQDGLEYGNAAVQDQLRSAQETVVGAVDEAQAWYDPDVESDRVQDQVLTAAQDIPNQDIIYEQLAHNLAYGRWDPKQLDAWGYEEPEELIEIDEVTGMNLWVVRPKNEPGTSSPVEGMHGKPLRAVLCFRGSSDAVDWADDLSPEGVGAFQFSAHQGEIAQAVSENSAWGPPDTTGHSLGGALAQLASTVGSVNRVVTFQSPGISQEYLDQAQTQEDATHHRAKNDIVAWAGDQHLDGESYIYDQTGAGFEPGMSHTFTMLNDLSARRGDSVPLLEEASFEGDPSHGRIAYLNQNAPDWNMDGQAGDWEQAYQDGRQWVSATGRDVLGAGLRVVDDVVSMENAVLDAVLPGDQAARNNGVATGLAGAGGNLLTGGQSMGVDPQQMELYIQIWQDVEPKVAQGQPVEEVCREIRSSALDAELCTRMVKQVELLEKTGGARDVRV